jgi:putative glutamine amidotransferase
MPYGCPTAALPGLAPRPHGSGWLDVGQSAAWEVCHRGAVQALFRATPPPDAFPPDRPHSVSYTLADMRRPPLILLSPNIEKKGDEFGDLSLSLSETYQQALMGAGAIPLALPVTLSRDLIAECVRRCDGVLLTGGEDVDPRVYGDGLPPRLRRKVNVTPDGGARDLRELVLIDEVFRQRKPLLGICRGHQMLNVALGGTLVADVASQLPGALNHRQMDRRSEIVHEARLTPDSLLAKITGKQRLGVNSTHHQAVAQVAPPLRATAASDDGVVEGLEFKPGAVHWLPFLLSVQFHPERLADRYPEHRALFQAFVEVCALNGKNTL